MRKEALVILAEGFEEIEAVTPIDVLRRAGVNVVIAGLASKNVRGSRRVVCITDMLLSEYQINPDVLILPGGVKGAENLHHSPQVIFPRMSAANPASTCATKAIKITAKADNINCGKSMRNGSYPMVPKNWL